MRRDQRERTFNGEDLSRALLLVAGGTFVLAALLYDPHLLAAVRGKAVDGLALEKVRATRVGFALAAAALGLASEALRRVPALRGLARLGAVPVVLLALASLLVPLALLEFGLRPFADSKTTIFTEDPRLGWRLAPGAVGEWGGVRVQVNENGLRGPEIEHARRPGVARILYLGDSLTFGFRIAEAGDTFPFLASAKLARDRGRPVETVNAGVGGWSPWQELRWYQDEGVRYAPDLVVVGFVLNDLTEKFGLARFGGTDIGWQLQHTARSSLDRWLSGSGIAGLLRDAYARLRFGEDVEAGAILADVQRTRRMATRPGRAEFEHAWSLTLHNLGLIFDLARQHETPALLLIFPYAFQLGLPAEEARAQRRLVGWAEARGIPVLDLLPGLRRSGQAPAALYGDPAHLSVEGHRRTSALLADFVARNGLL